MTTEMLADDDEFAGLVRSILAASDLHLDLSGFDLEGGQRLDPRTLLLLSNLFLGAAADTPVEVTFPPTDSARLAAMRSGLLFSLLARDGSESRTKVTLPGASEEAVSCWRELWTQPWSPREPAVGRLFEDEPRVVDSKDYAGAGQVITNPSNAKKATRVVVDPHRRSREFLHSRSSQGLARRWLRLVTPASKDPLLTKRRETWMSLVSGRILAEPLLNLADHAVKCPPGSQPRSHIRSLALLARTEGGGSKSHPRLQMLVADSGYGVIDTLRPKLERSEVTDERRLSRASPLEILEFTVTRPAKTAKDPGLPWARVGFQVAVAEATAPELHGTDELDAQFTVITGDPDRNRAAVWVDIGRDGIVSSGDMPSLPFIGTSVFVTVPMPKPQTDESDFTSTESSSHANT